MRIITKPQIFFFLLAIVLLVIGIIYKTDHIDIAIYGTITKLDIWSISLFSTMFFILIGINYTSLTLTKKSPKKGLTLAHIIFQVLALIPLVYFIFTNKALRSYEQVAQMNIILILAFVIFILATVLHLINFIASLVKKQD